MDDEMAALLRNGDGNNEEDSLNDRSNEEVGSNNDEEWDDFLRKYSDVDIFGAEESQTEFHFIPNTPANLENDNAEAGPGPQTTANRLRTLHTLDDNDDDRTTIWTKHAGTIIRQDHPPSYNTKQKFGDTRTNRFIPFASELDWKVARWAVMDGPGQNAIDRLLQIPGRQVVEKLGLSFKNVRSLHKKLDTMPDKAGKWKVRKLAFKDRLEETFTIRYRNPVEAVKSLWKDPQLSKSMVYQPAKVFSGNVEDKNRIFSEMWTGKWWHAIQSKLPSGATVAPIIIATDKTQLTQFSGGKSAYPVYLTIGNIPKAIRRKPSKHACILIAYLSVEKLDRTMMNDQQHRSRIQRLFHESMRIVLLPLIDAGNNGVEMASCDGAIRKVHPILTCYVADYPEQCLVTCTKYGTCVKCQAPATDLGQINSHTPRTQKWTTTIIEEGKHQANGRSNSFHDYCMSYNVAGSVYKPFWDGFPLADIHRAITPDVLHQLYQGVFKHLVVWCQKALSPSKLDQRIRCLPIAYGVRRFKNGISALSQVSGSERKQMAKILLGCLVGSMPNEGIYAVTAILDFIYIAQYSTHNKVTLGYLQDSLVRFHQYRHYFLDINARKDFNIPKFHSLIHYVEAIEQFGTTDNYNTEMFERLHIDFAKQGWRASNQKDEFPQMINWLSRREKIAGFTGYQEELSLESMDRAQSTSIDKDGDITMNPPSLLLSSSVSNHSLPFPKSLTISKLPISIAKKPNFINQRIDLIEEKHMAPDFSYYLKVFLNTFSSNPTILRNLDNIPLPFQKLDVYNMFRLHLELINDDQDSDEKAIVKAIPKSAKLPSGQFDTIVAITSEDAESTGLQGTKIGHVRVIFTLPKTIQTYIGSLPAPDAWPTIPLAYVEWKV
ncbi:hypothetical protein JR316_0003882 [Psilocybe cubensis]|uniref:Uncharacterized protein n=1 Tax=Psilocybe cubensis TaxID=181762 RepID=A0ACB8H909_PSICU|nr:hypothetical protein JR316_0003882 [Psilocybe cubensis]KAH9484401.1 hypothetical protein JR316_0003882 [Psilocybe cubensis]